MVQLARRGIAFWIAGALLLINGSLLIVRRPAAGVKPGTVGLTESVTREHLITGRPDPSWFTTVKEWAGTGRQSTTFSVTTKPWRIVFDHQRGTKYVRPVPTTKIAEWPRGPYRGSKTEFLARAWQVPIEAAPFDYLLPMVEGSSYVATLYRKGEDGRGEIVECMSAGITNRWDVGTFWLEIDGPHDWTVAVQQKSPLD